jgi:hypothetical protein
MEKIIVGFSVGFVMINALYLLVSRVATFVIKSHGLKKFDFMTDSTIKEILATQNEIIAEKRAETEKLKKENSLLRIKAEQLEENNEHLSVKLRNLQDG